MLRQVIPQALPSFLNRGPGLPNPHPQHRLDPGCRVFLLRRVLRAMEAVQGLIREVEDVTHARVPIIKCVCVCVHNRAGKGWFWGQWMF